MSMQPKVSIILTCYNQGRFLEESIGSLLAQTWTEWECVLIDDGSTDSTSVLAQKLCAQDSRIQYYRQENSGVSTARNKGLALAKGQYLQFLDGDDKLHPHKLAYQVAQLDMNPTIGIIFGSSRYFFNSEPDKLYPLHPNGAIPCDLKSEDEYQVEMILKGNICTNCAMLLRRDLLGDLQFRDMIYEDWIFNLECALRGMKFHFDNSSQSYSYVRISDSSLMAKHTGKLIKAEKFQMTLLEITQAYGYRVDEKLIALPQVGLAYSLKNVIRQLTPPVMYTWAAIIRRRIGI